jgi:hypothetical protein
MSDTALDALESALRDFERVAGRQATRAWLAGALASLDAPQGRYFSDDFDAAYRRLDGGHNLVSLVALRRALGGYSREAFDRGLWNLRRVGVYSCAAAERDVSAADRAAGVEEDGLLLLYVSRRGK